MQGTKPEVGGSGGGSAGQSINACSLLIVAHTSHTLPAGAGGDKSPRAIGALRSIFCAELTQAARHAEA